MKNKKEKKRMIEIRSQSLQRIEAKDLSINKPTGNPHSRRSNNFITETNKYLIEAKSKPEINLSTNNRRFTLQTEGNYRSRTTIAKNKLPSLNSPKNMQTNLESYDQKTKVNYPPTCIRKIREFNFHSTNDQCNTISNNDFRKRSNVFKKSLDEKILSPTIVSKRKSSEINPKEKDLFIHAPTFTHCMNNNNNNFNKPRIAKSSKISINAKSISSQDSDKSDIEDEEYFKIDSNGLKCKSFALTQPGKDSKGDIKTNQDSYLLEENILNINGYNIYGIMDGHGTNGHHVSQYISKEAKIYFSNEESYHSQKNKAMILNENMVIDKLEYHNYDFIDLFYKQMAKDLPNAKFDVHFSGSTCVMVLKIGKKLICANTGDSRAILIKETPDSSSNPNSNSSDPFKNYKAIHLSNDHKPEVEGERKRIEESGGRVDQYEDDGYKNGPFRVWVKGELYPGIAISRTLGDEIAESVGVIYKPDIICHYITSNDRYFVLASDGVWEFLENSKVMDIINPFYLKNDPEGACKAVISESIRWWQKEDIVIDDISIIICFLNNLHMPFKKNSV